MKKNRKKRRRQHKAAKRARKTAETQDSRPALEVAVEHHRAGRLAEAERIYKQILRVQPGNAGAHNNLGVALKNQDKLDEAIACYKRALKADPNHIEAYNNLGNALKEQKKLDEAIAWYRRALEVNPDYAEARNSLGAILQEQGRVDEAIACFLRALKVTPDDASAHNNLGIVYKEEGRLEESITCYERAIEIEPDYSEAHNNLGNALKDQGDLDSAIDCYKRAIKLKSDYASAHFNLGFTLLTVGRLEEGWVEHEWRWRRTDAEFKPRDFTQPQWDGSRLDGQTILLHAEQGLGDAIQFSRYFPIVAEYGGRVVVECHPLVIPLLQTVGGIDQLVRKRGKLPPFDVQIPFLSLPLAVGTTLETIPCGAGYIKADSRFVDMWRERLSGLKGPRVGLCWQGNPKFPGDRWRSIPLKHFTGLFNGRSTTFVNLHKGVGEPQIEECGLTDRMVNFSPQVKSFMDTAAIMENLDLVITSDTSVAHLAGALGRPVWTLLQSVPDWRWMLEREDMPWYPTMRLFRQQTRGDWEGLLRRVERALDEHLAQ